MKRITCLLCAILLLLLPACGSANDNPSAEPSETVVSTPPETPPPPTHPPPPHPPII